MLLSARAHAWRAFSPRGVSSAACFALLLVACDDPSGVLPEPADDAGASALRGDAAGAEAAPLPELAACAALSQEPVKSTSDIVERVNALPAPVSLECLLASLPRPLSLVGSASPASLQPALGADNPRFFLMLEKVVLSVVPAGPAASFLEFGEWVTPRRTIKGELEFPVRHQVDVDEPFLREGGQGKEEGPSACGLCHSAQEAHPTIDGAFVSDALRPVRYSEMTLAELRATRASCTGAALDTDRCRLLRAIFDYGEVRQGAFDEAVKEGF